MPLSERDAIAVSTALLKVAVAAVRLGVAHNVFKVREAAYTRTDLTDEQREVLLSVSAEFHGPTEAFDLWAERYGDQADPEASDES